MARTTRPLTHTEVQKAKAINKTLPSIMVMVYFC